VGPGVAYLKKFVLMRLVCLSDTHSFHDRIAGGVPDGDVLIHAGDFCGQNSKIAVGTFLEWWAEQPHKHKVLIAGNHDGNFEFDPTWCRKALAEICPETHYLQDTGCEIEGVKFFGEPWQPEFNNWHFNLPRGSKLAEKWALIPDDTDVLVTHGPPHGILDECPEWLPTFNQSRTKTVHVGCEELTKALVRIKPKVHVFGHIHEGYGRHLGENGTLYINAANVDGQYQPVNPAQVVDI